MFCFYPKQVKFWFNVFVGAVCALVAICGWDWIKGIFDNRRQTIDNGKKADIVDDLYVRKETLKKMNNDFIKKNH